MLTKYVFFRSSKGWLSLVRFAASGTHSRRKDTGSINLISHKKKHDSSSPDLSLKGQAFLRNLYVESLWWGQKLALVLTRETQLFRWGRMCSLIRFFLCAFLCALSEHLAHRGLMIAVGYAKLFGWGGSERAWGRSNLALRFYPRPFTILEIPSLIVASPKLISSPNWRLVALR